MALLHLVMPWALANGRTVMALTVDHGLNPMSHEWTRQAGQMARTLGAEWRALSWDGPKPSAGLQAKARRARHGLLADAAREAKASVILMGHTADDIAEGETMRERDAPALGSLRSWSPSPVWPEGRSVFLLRPLLNAQRLELRRHLLAHRLEWLDDPANEDLKFARVRARAALAGEPKQAQPGPDKLDLSQLARTMTFAPSAASASFTTFCEAEPAAAIRVISAALVSVSGRSRPPRGHELERLWDGLRRGRRMTLSGCVVEVRDDVLDLRREPGRADACPSAEPVDWVANRFAGACGLIENEGELARRWARTS